MSKSKDKNNDFWLLTTDNDGALSVYTYVVFFSILMTYNLVACLDSWILCASYVVPYLKILISDNFRAYHLKTWHYF